MTIKHGKTSNRCLICYKLLRTWKGTKLCNSYDIRKKSNLNDSQLLTNYCLPSLFPITSLTSLSLSVLTKQNKQIKTTTKNGKQKTQQQLTSPSSSSSSSSSSKQTSNQVLTSSSTSLISNLSALSTSQASTISSKLNNFDSNDNINQQISSTATSTSSTISSNNNNNNKSCMTIIDLINKTINSNSNNNNKNIFNNNCNTNSHSFCSSNNHICEYCYKNLLLVYYFMSQASKYRNIVKRKLFKSHKLTSNYKKKQATDDIKNENLCIKNEDMTVLKESNSSSNRMLLQQKKNKIDTLINLKSNNNTTNSISNCSERGNRKYKTVSDLLSNCDNNKKLNQTAKTTTITTMVATNKVICDDGFNRSNANKTSINNYELNFVHNKKINNIFNSNNIVNEYNNNIVNNSNANSNNNNCQDLNSSNRRKRKSKVSSNGDSEAVIILI